MKTFVEVNSCELVIFLAPSGCENEPPNLEPCMSRSLNLWILAVLKGDTRNVNDSSNGTNQS